MKIDLFICRFEDVIYPEGYVHPSQASLRLIPKHIVTSKSLSARATLVSLKVLFIL